MTLKKKFDTPQAARDAVHGLRRAGADAFCRGRYVTAIVGFCGDAMSAFAGWEVISQ